jgi:hypothetical protein
MPHYIVGKRWRFDELGRKADAGEEIELTEEQAKTYIDSEPDLIKPVRQRTQSSPKVVRQKTARKTSEKSRR